MLTKTLMRERIAYCVNHAARLGCGHKLGALKNLQRLADKPTVSAQDLDAKLNRLLLSTHP